MPPTRTLSGPPHCVPIWCCCAQRLPVSPALKRLVSVALILASRRGAVSSCAALCSPDVPPARPCGLLRQRRSGGLHGRRLSPPKPGPGRQRAARRQCKKTLERRVYFAPQSIAICPSAYCAKRCFLPFYLLLLFYQIRPSSVSSTRKPLSASLLPSFSSPP